MLVSFLLNCLIVVMTVFGFIAMFVGWDFMGKEGNLESTGARMLRFFTIDSNVLMGVCSLIMAVAQIKVLTGKAECLPAWVYGIKLMGTTAVMLTLLVTFCFLMPNSEKPISLLYNSNLFFHLITPVIAALSFIVFERTDTLAFGYTLIGVIPTLLYEVYYVINVLTHLNDGIPDRKYDFYNFLNGRVKRAPFVVVAILAISYLICLALWALN